MRKGLVCLLGALLLLPVQSAVADISWYLGAGGSWTSLTTSNFSSIVNLDSPAALPPPAVYESVSATSGNFRDSPFGWQVFAGVQFTENFGLVVKYNDSGKGKDQWVGNSFANVDPDGVLPPPAGEAADQFPVRTDYAFTGEMQLDGFTIYLTQTVPLGDKFDFALEVGWTQQDIDFLWSSTATQTPAAPTVQVQPLPQGRVTGDDSSFALGALLRYKFLGNLALTTELEWLLLDFGGLIDRPVRLNVNLEVHF